MVTSTDSGRDYAPSRQHLSLLASVYWREALTVVDGRTDSCFEREDWGREKVRSFGAQLPMKLGNVCVTRPEAPGFSPLCDTINLPYRTGCAGRTSGREGVAGP